LFFEGVWDMYIRKYKLNYSYTTYVVVETEFEVPTREFPTHKKKKALEWKKGSTVKHAFHGKGTIVDITEGEITVKFNKSKKVPCLRNFVVTFDFKNKPSEINNLHLCD
jgi:hypothetical protein